jgi:hypothetical protein
MSSMTMFQDRQLSHARQKSRRHEFLSLNVATVAADNERPESVPSADVPTHSKIFLDFETV